MSSIDMTCYIFSVPKDKDFQILVKAFGGLEPTLLGDRFSTLSRRLEAGRVNEAIRWNVTEELPSDFLYIFGHQDLSYRYQDVSV